MEKDKLLTIGRNGEMIEVFDLEDPTRQCSLRLNVSMKVDTIGLLNDSNPIFCHLDTTENHQCVAYTMINDEIEELHMTIGTLGSDVGYTTSVVFNGLLWLSGGYDYQNDVFIKQTQTLESGTLVNTLGIPTKLYQHCLVPLDDSILVIGGSDMENQDQDLILNQDNFFVKPDLKSISSAPKSLMPRYGHACARLNNSVFVVGGKTKNGLTDTMEVLDLSTMIWSFGPSLLTLISEDIDLVAFEDSLVLLSGNADDGQPSFYKYTCTYGFCEWTVFEGYKVGAYYGALHALMIPSNFTNCD